MVRRRKTPALSSATPKKCTPCWWRAPATNGLQFFGQVDIDAKTLAMTVTLKDLAGTSLYAKTLAPQRA